MGRISTTLQDIRIRDTIYQVLRTGPGAHNHYHHYQSHAVKQKPKIQNQQNNQYSCNKYPKSIFFKRCTSQSCKILTTLSPALFLEKDKRKRKNIHLNLRSSNNGATILNLWVPAIHKGKFPCLKS